MTSSLRPPAGAFSVVVACTLSAACGGLTDLDVEGYSRAGAEALRDGGRVTADYRRELDAGVPDDADDDGSPEDAWAEWADAEPGANVGSEADVIYASPSFVTVAAGSWGYTDIVVAGPWSERLVEVAMESSTLPVTRSYIVWSPERLEFLTTAPAGSRGTITVTGSEDGILRTTKFTVEVTACVPYTPEYACSFDVGTPLICGNVSDGCGGSVSCGTCPADAQYCFQNFYCIACQPQVCSPGAGFNPMTCQCQECGEGCFSSEGGCSCKSGGTPPGFP